jgi:L-lactate dehydrogenase complex protein LldF
LKLVGKVPWYEKFIFRMWTAATARKWAYVMGQRVQRFFMRNFFGAKDGWISRMPGPAKGWTQARDFPMPPKKTFRQLWKDRRTKPQSHRVTEDARRRGEK